MRRSKFNSVVGRSTILFLVGMLSAPAYAQGGSTGGTIGKQSKSASGESESGAVAPARKQRAKPNAVSKDDVRETKSSCGRIVGRWDWGSTGSVVFAAAGTATVSNGDSAVWTCRDGLYTIKWAIFGNTTQGTVSADGKQFAGVGVLGSFVATRK